MVIYGKEFNEEQLKDFINMYNYENFEELEEKYKSKQQLYEAIREKWKILSLEHYETKKWEKVQKIIKHADADKIKE